jgi:hypothetical protein
MGYSSGRNSSNLNTPPGCNKVTDNRQGGEPRKPDSEGWPRCCVHVQRTFVRGLGWAENHDVEVTQVLL